MLVRQPAAIIIGQAHAPGAQLAAEAPVFFDQVGDDLPFPAGQPVGHDHQKQWKGRGIDHRPELISRSRRRRRLTNGTVRGSNRSTIRSARKCYLCARNELSPMCPEWTEGNWLAALDDFRNFLNREVA